MTTTTGRKGDKADRIGRLSGTLDSSIRMAAFLDDPEISRMFETIKQNQIDIMINAAADDDATRRGAALRLQALSELRAIMAGMAQLRVKLESKLEELTADGA